MCVDDGLRIRGEKSRAPEHVPIDGLPHVASQLGSKSSVQDPDVRQPELVRLLLGPWGPHDGDELLHAWKINCFTSLSPRI